MMEITNNDGSLGLGTSKTIFQPVRKKPVLYAREGNSIYKLASFNDEKAMREFWRVMNELGIILPKDLSE